MNERESFTRTGIWITVVAIDALVLALLAYFEPIWPTEMPAGLLVGTAAGLLATLGFYAALGSGPIAQRFAWTILASSAAALIFTYCMAAGWRAAHPGETSASNPGHVTLFDLVRFALAMLAVAGGCLAPLMIARRWYGWELTFVAKPKGATTAESGDNEATEIPIHSEDAANAQPAGQFTIRDILLWTSAAGLLLLLCRLLIPDPGNDDPAAFLLEVGASILGGALFGMVVSVTTAPCVFLVLQAWPSPRSRRNAYVVLSIVPTLATLAILVTGIGFRDWLEIQLSTVFVVWVVYLAAQTACTGAMVAHLLIARKLCWRLVRAADGESGGQAEETGRGILESSDSGG